MHYVRSRIETEERAFLYRVYCTDGIKAIAENTARTAGGSTLQKRWVEFLDRKEITVQKSADEIAADIICRAGLRQKGGE